MAQEDIIGALGAVISSILAALGFLWSLGALQLIFTFLAGSFTTYVVQHRLQIESEKRRISRERDILMRDQVYGPLFESMNLSLEWIEAIKEPSPGNLLADIGVVLKKYLFLLADASLRNNISRIYEDLNEYLAAKERAERAVYDISIPKLAQAYSEAKDADPRQTYFWLRDHNIIVKHTDLVTAILKRENPVISFRHQMVELESPAIEVVIRNYNVEDLDKISEVFTEIECLAWKENRLITYEEKRRALMENIKKIIPELKKKIVP